MIVISHSPISPASLEAEATLLLTRVPAWRAEQAARYRHPQGRYDCLKSWAMLQDLLAEMGLNADALEVRYNEFGKPYFVDGPFFSLSHCRGAIAVMVCETECGIDIEPIDRKVSPSLIAHTMCDAEQASIGTDTARFFERWTQKEALLKCLGTGITDEIRDILLSPHGCRLETHSDDRFVWSEAVRGESRPANVKR